jgi:hypothetical protein
MFLTIALAPRGPRYRDAMTGPEDLFSVLGQLGEMGNGVAANLLGASIPELLKDAVEGVEGFEFLAEPVREAMAGLGGLGMAYGPEIAKTLAQLTDSVKGLLESGGGTEMLEQVLQRFMPPKGD